MNDLIKSSELTQFLLQHSIINLNNGIKPDAREDDSVFGGVWVQPEEDSRKNALSLTGTEIWGPKPQVAGEKNDGPIKGASSEVTPEPGKRDSFLFGNASSNQDFANSFPAYSPFTDNSFGLISSSADIPLNQNSGPSGQRRTDVLPKDKKLESLGSIWSGSCNHGVPADALESLNRCEWKQPSLVTNASPAVLQKSNDASPLDKFPEFYPGFDLRKDPEKSSAYHATGLASGWGVGVKQTLPCTNDGWMLPKGSPDFTMNPMMQMPAPGLASKTNQNPQCFSPWEQAGKSFFPSLEDAWSNGGSSSGILENQLLASQQNKLLTNLNNSASVPKDLPPLPMKFDPSIPPPPLPGLSSFGSDLRLLSASTGLPQDQLLNLLKSGVGAQAKSQQQSNLTKPNLASSFKSQIQPGHLGAGLGGGVSGYGVQHPVGGPSHPWATEQRLNDIKLAVLYRKLARQLFPGHQSLHTRSKKLQQLISLGFKREEAGKVLMNNDLDFELTLGELVFKTAVSKGLIEDPFGPTGSVGLLLTQYQDMNFLRGITGMNKQGETFQNYFNNLEHLVQKQQQQQLMMAHATSRFSGPMQPQIDYTIQALLNGQPNNPSLSGLMPNLNFSGSGQAYSGGSRFQSNPFDPPPSSAMPRAVSPPFATSRSRSVSNLDPRSPEWIPASNHHLDADLLPFLSDPRPAAADGPLEVANSLNNLKLDGRRQQPSRYDESVARTWSSSIGKTFSAAPGEPSKSAFSIPGQQQLPPSSSFSSISIKEFIPGVPWNKETNSTESPKASATDQRQLRSRHFGGSSSSSSGGGGAYLGLSDDSGFVGSQLPPGEVGSTSHWMHGGDEPAGRCKERTEWSLDRKMTRSFFDRGYALDSIDGGEDGILGFSGDDVGYEGSLDGSSPPFKSNWIVIKNIPEKISEEEMSRALIVYGSMKSATYMKDTRSVLVCYENTSDAVDAKNGFDYAGEEEGGEAFAKMSAEFVPDWTTSISGPETKDHQHPYDKTYYHGVGGGDYQEEQEQQEVEDEEEEASTEEGSPSTPPSSAEVGYTTQGGLWIPSEVLQNLEFRCPPEVEEEEDDDVLLAEAERSEEVGFND